MAATDVCRAGQCFDPVVEIATGTNHSCALRASGSAWCWGRNETGQLGTGDFVDSPSPIRVLDIDDAVHISSAGFIAGGFPGVNCVTRGSGEVWCWGANASAQLGDGTTQPRNRPVRVAGLTLAVDVSTGFGSTCAMRSGTAYLQCWGRRLGTMDMMDLVPAGVIGIPTDLQLRSIDVGGAHACALDIEGGVWCWGRNASGQLGDSDGDRIVARRVAGLPPVAEVVVGLVHTCAREESGQVWCWGAAMALGLGMDELVPVPTPQELSTISNARRIFAGPSTFTTCAIRADRSVWCWGGDIIETVRTGASVAAPVPVEMAELHSAEVVATSTSHMCALWSDGSVACLGSNQFGQLGDGTTEDRLTPVAVVLP